MLEIPIIDSRFILEWEPQYDSVFHDQGRYVQILDAVSKDIVESGVPSKDTFSRIVEWKAERAKSKIRLDRFEDIYKPRLRLVFSGSVFTHHKLPILVESKDKLLRDLPVAHDVLSEIHYDAHGIGVPIASTILHFGYPNDFPIIDVRVVQTLYFAGKLSSIKRDVRQYSVFQSVMLSIAKQHRCSLRQIDRALFAYHKRILQPAVGLPLDAPEWMQRQAIDRLKRESRSQQH